MTIWTGLDPTSIATKISSSIHAGSTRAGWTLTRLSYRLSGPADTSTHSACASPAPPQSRAGQRLSEQINCLAAWDPKPGPALTWLSSPNYTCWKGTSEACVDRRRGDVMTAWILPHNTLPGQTAPRCRPPCAAGACTMPPAAPRASLAAGGRRGAW